MSGETNLEKLQRLLREMFQFDSAELDFGIYRIMNYKRDVIEKFITKDLPESISEELSKGSLSEQSRAAAELQKTSEKIVKDFGKDALDADGNLSDAFQPTPVGKKYLELKEKVSEWDGSQASEVLIYNHLYTFLSRYYDNGDFLSKRRYSKKEKYSIPYNGEEVYLHWANSDQYYIKTGEYFQDYTFTSQGITFHFKLQNADVEHDNVKGNKRFFLPRPADISYVKKKKNVVIPFEYRPLTEQEQISYGKKNQQERIILEALGRVPKRFGAKDTALAALSVEHHKASDKKSVSVLEHHLRRYTRRNISDFFIHKDLKGFLERELGFYLKNEVLNLDELEIAGEARTEGWFQIMLTIKNVGSKIITFLAQIEDFQKKLFEKKKFITETQYCITVGNIPEDFYEEIAENDAQWDEWRVYLQVESLQKGLFSKSPKTKKNKRIETLKAFPTLVIDTKHFNQDYKDRLINEFDDIDEQTDGLLIHADSFQALNLILQKYGGEVKCVYIDPPYNTGNDEFIYKDNYRHASWLSMIWDRLVLGGKLLSADGIFWCTLDDNEKDQFREISKRIFGLNCTHPVVVWQHSIQGKGYAGTVSVGHNYVLPFSRTSTGGLGVLERTEEHNVNYSNPDNDPNGDWRPGDVRNALYRPRLIYDIPTPSGKKIKPPPKGWRWSWETVQKKIDSGEIVFSEDESRIIRKIYLKGQSGRVPDSIWSAKEVGSTRTANSELKALFGTPPEYTTAKPTGLIDRMITLSANEGGIVVDYFGGSGTTAHAVINKNRDNGGDWQFVLVELAHHFKTILLPRVKKVMFAKEWKNGIPLSISANEEIDRSPRIVKYIELESYEDSLNNLSFTQPDGQLVLKFDDYTLKYMLQWETKDSDTFLNIEKLNSPFSYKISIAQEQETKERLIDLPETFNYLLGLHVKSRRVYNSGKQKYLVYRGNIDHKEISVIWRETKGWKKTDFEKDKKFVVDQKLTDGADEIFVNSDSLIPKAKSLDPIFKNRMFAKVQ